MFSAVLTVFVTILGLFLGTIIPILSIVFSFDVTSVFGVSIFGEGFLIGFIIFFDNFFCSISTFKVGFFFGRTISSFE